MSNCFLFFTIRYIIIENEIINIPIKPIILFKNHEKIE
jgi:hypothetical protein